MEPERWKPVDDLLCQISNPSARKLSFLNDRAFRPECVHIG